VRLLEAERLHEPDKIAGNLACAEVTAGRRRPATPRSIPSDDRILVCEIVELASPQPAVTR
jgi:phosphatidylserine decarboxylase